MIALKQIPIKNNIERQIWCILIELLSVQNWEHIHLDGKPADGDHQQPYRRAGPLPLDPVRHSWGGGPPEIQVTFVYMSSRGCLSTYLKDSEFPKYENTFRWCNIPVHLFSILISKYWFYNLTICLRALIVTLKSKLLYNQFKDLFANINMPSDGCRYIWLCNHALSSCTVHHTHILMPGCSVCRVQASLEEEEKTDSDRFLEECIQDPTLRDKLSILSRTFQNRKQVSPEAEWSAFVSQLWHTLKSYIFVGHLILCISLVGQITSLRSRRNIIHLVILHIFWNLQI